MILAGCDVGLTVLCVLGLRALRFLVGWYNIAFLGLVLCCGLIVLGCFLGLLVWGLSVLRLVLYDFLLVLADAFVGIY